MREDNNNGFEDCDVDKFEVEILKVIDYFSKEYHLSYAEMIGELELIKLSIYDELKEDNEEDA